MGRRTLGVYDVEAVADAALRDVERRNVVRQVALGALFLGWVVFVLAPAPRSGGRRG